MRAVVQNEFGGPEVLTLSGRDVPQPLPTEVQVEVHYAGVNPVDAKTREGASVAMAMGGFPLTVGWDVAGIVSQLGAGVTRFAVGDRVYGMPRFPRACGAYAQYVTAPSRQLVKVPSTLDLKTAAAVPLPATTAWQIVVDVAAVGVGQRVLILGAGGSVGRFAVQIAKHRGAHVIGTARGDQLGDLAGMGLDEGIDYTRTEFEQLASAVDVVIDLVGGSHTRRAVAVTKNGGMVVSVPSGRDVGLDAAAAEAGVTVTGLIVEPDRVALEGVSAMIDGGLCIVPAPHVFDLDQVVEVHERLAKGAAKMVLEVVR